MLRDDDRAALADMWAVAQAQPAAFAIECEVWCASAGRHRWCVARAVPILDPDGSVREWIGALNDVDDRQRAERELAQTNAELARSNADLGRSNTELARSNADLEQFAYVASHDLQEPLRMVASYLQLLQRRYQGHLDADADEFIHFAVDGATRMKGLINALLEYSRVRTRGRPLELVDADLALDQALHDLSLAVEDSGALVSREPLPTVLADGRQLGQVFLNLIGNALKFHGDAPPRVHVCAERADGQWRFAVRDNGIGLDPEFGERIFGIFERLNAGATYPGTGIGLAVCKSILERHGGRIWVESQPGAGATFFFTLPAVGEVS
jgi:light-regulated signal transduction histidine kinase (bacteriophytochrome)